MKFGIMDSDQSNPLTLLLLNEEKGKGKTNRIFLSIGIHYCFFHFPLSSYMSGLFSDSHMEYDIHPDAAGEPSLAEMTQKAIQILEKNPNGFFLLVEGM